MKKIIIIRKPGPTDLTFKEQNPADWRYQPEDDSKLRNFVQKCKAEKKFRNINGNKKINNENAELTERWKPIFQLKNLSYVYSNGKSFEIEVPVFGGCSRLRNPTEKEYQEILEFLEKIEGIVGKFIKIEEIINRKIEEDN